MLKKEVENARLALEVKHLEETLQGCRKAWEKEKAQLEQNAEDFLNEFVEYKSKVQLMLIARDNRDEKLIKELRQQKIKVKIYEERIEEFNRMNEAN